jgi:thiosulfate/3-mercaptopyruvate sulfurtransferase
MTSEVLIETAELAALLAAEEPPVLADVRWALAGPPGRPEFEAAHLPGAQFVDLEHELSGPPGAGGRHPLPPPAVFEAAMRAIGVREDRLVVAYDAATSQAAARLWWLLTDAGHPSVRVLNGGLAAWQAEDRPTEAGPAAAVSPGDFVVRPGQRRQATAAEIEAALIQERRPLLVDVRAPERFSGATEPVDPVAGHIPGAINLPAAGNHDPSGRFLDAEALRLRYAAAGVGGDAVLYCGSGVTAAQSLLALESAGLTAGIYPGSWSDWIRDPRRPVATGSA